MKKRAKAKVDPIRQRTQYTCVATSILMALRALGKDLNEDQVNRILGAEPKKGARWEEALATIQYFGCRGTLTAPSTLGQIKGWTDQGLPVLIAWNPEGRPWSHASVVFHVEQGPPETWAEGVGDDAQIQGSGEGMYVWVADPNIPNPSKMYRIVHEQEFYEKWGEDWGDFIVRRPALVVSVEVDAGGRQVMASNKSGGRKGKRPQRVNQPKDPREKYRVRGKAPKDRNEIAEALAANRGQGNPGPHHNRSKDVAKGRSRKPKHRGKSDWKQAETAVANTEVQSSFYKRLEGEPLQVTPLRTMPDYGERDFNEERTMMDLKDMLAELTDSTKNTKKTAKLGLKRERVWKHRKDSGSDVYSVQLKGSVPFSNMWVSVDAIDANAEKSATLTVKMNDGTLFNKSFKGKGIDAKVRAFELADEVFQAKSEDPSKMGLRKTTDAPRTASARPAGGLYGYTKSTQRDVLASVRKVQKSANRIAKTIYAKDKNTFNFLHLHAERSNSLSARILCAAMENIGPKVAAETDTKTAGKTEYLVFPPTKHNTTGEDITGFCWFNDFNGWWICDTATYPMGEYRTEEEAIRAMSGAGYDARRVKKTTRKQRHKPMPIYDKSASTKTAAPQLCAGSNMDPSSVNCKAPVVYLDSNGYVYCAKHAPPKGGRNRVRKLRPAEIKKVNRGEMYALKYAGHGMYGYRVKTAKLALQACLDISQEAGSVAYDLHTRRTAKYAKITSFLKDHSKRGRCRYARLLLRFYPDAPVVTASEDADEKEAKHEKGKSVALKDMPKEMQENAKDPSKHIKPKKKKKASEIEDLNMQVLAALEADDVDEDEKLALLEKAKKVYNTLTNSQKSAGGCDNLPNEAMVENCKKKQEEAKDSKEAEDDSDKTAGCEKLPNEAMQKACEDKKKEGEENSDDDGDKKASRVRLTTRVATGEIQRGLIRFAADEEDGEEDDEKSADNMGRSQLPGESDGNQVQPKLEGNSGYNPGSTELNGDSGAPKAAADAAELAAKAEGSTTLPGDDESDKIQPDMNTHGYEVGHAVKTKKSSDSETWATTSLPDGATLIWVE